MVSIIKVLMEMVMEMEIPWTIMETLMVVKTVDLETVMVMEMVTLL